MRILHFCAVVLLKLFENKAWLWLVGILVFDALILFIYLSRKKKAAKAATITTTQILPVAEVSIPPATASALPAEERTSSHTSSILLFGTFQFYLSKEKEISGKLSPLLKELFLLILLHSAYSSRGISSNSIIEKIWPDMADKNARNNLAVNIGKLRGILGPDFHEQLINQSGSWTFEIPANGSLYCDYISCLRMMQSRQEYSLSDIQTLIASVNKGGLLLGLNYEWLDAFKETISNTLIDTLLAFVSLNSLNISAHLLIQIADTIMLLDMANEQAMELKCKALVSLGKHSLANDIYLKFIKEYKTLYNMDYPKDFKSIIG
ncbi:MAG: hypothetical protein H7259_04510 [Cytophagales bacterium]|nr:hypothetical protein [Cytophaga sp.]